MTLSGKLVWVLSHIESAKKNKYLGNVPTWENIGFSGTTKDKDKNLEKKFLSLFFVVLYQKISFFYLLSFIFVVLLSLSKDKNVENLFIILSGTEKIQSIQVLPFNRLTEVNGRPARSLSLELAFPNSWDSDLSEYVIRRWAHLHTLL